MSFPGAWLRLREPFDHAARSVALADGLGAILPRPARILELGAGLGSGLRWLAPRLRGPQDWILVDHDPELVAAIPEAVTGWAADNGVAAEVDGDRLRLGELTVRTQQRDIRDLDPLPSDVDAVTCQALLDLASHAWLEAFARWLAQHRLPLLASLTVDGRVTWTPALPLDDEVQSAFRLHQLGDRGFGASPGPRAADELADHLRMRGYTVKMERADWIVGERSQAMMREMVRGTAHAAAEVHPEPERVARWEAERLAAVDDGRLGLVVGHVDLLAVPAG